MMVVVAVTVVTRVVVAVMMVSHLASELPVMGFERLLRCGGGG